MHHAAAAAGGTKQNTLLTFAAEAEQSVGGAMCLLCEGVQRLSECERERERESVYHPSQENETVFLSPTCPSRSTIVLTLITKSEGSGLRNVSPKQKHPSGVYSKEGQGREKKEGGSQV